MDRKLVAWGLRRRRGGLPRLWLFTDERRQADPRRSVADLPPGAAGVVLRHDGCLDRAALGRDVARICRERRLALVVAGDARLAARLGAGVHLRGGRWPGLPRRGGLVTSSAHSVVELRRAQAAGAALVFLSPAFATGSHPGAAGLGAVRWGLMARRGGLILAGQRIDSSIEGRPGGVLSISRAAACRLSMATLRASRSPLMPAWRRADGRIAALGGVDGRTVVRLPARFVYAIGAIGALASD